MQLFNKDMTVLKLLAINALDLTIPASDLLWKTTNKSKTTDAKNWCQLSGHPDSLAPAGPGTIWKRLLSKSEQQIYESLMCDSILKDLVPFYYRTIEFDSQKFIEIEDLLAGFNNPTLMDIKMGHRTFCESEAQNKTLRSDLFQKMAKIDSNAFTDQERQQEAVTKLRYMQFREQQSSTSTLGFRIEAVKLANHCPEKLSTIRSRDSINETLQKYLENRSDLRNLFVHKLKTIRTNLERSAFFRRHEFIGSSLFFCYDNFKIGVWMIDFAKTNRIPNSAADLTHRNHWLPGNFEEGFLFGLDNLITVFENLPI